MNTKETVDALIDGLQLLGVCAGCNRKFAEHRPPVGWGFLIERHGVGVAGYRLCEYCTDRRAGDRKFRRRLADESFRTIYGCGPDQVVGGAQ